MKEKALEYLKKAVAHPSYSWSSAYSLNGIGYALLEVADAIRTLDTSDSRIKEVPE